VVQTNLTTLELRNRYENYFLLPDIQFSGTQMQNGRRIVEVRKKPHLKF
jgi:hypothetical protein